MKKWVCAFLITHAYQKMISFEEIYLFMETENQLNPIKVYDKITQNEKLEITREKLIQFLTPGNHLEHDPFEVVYYLYMQLIRDSNKMPCGMEIPEI